jgi:hypothetical protein
VKVHFELPGFAVELFDLGFEGVDGDRVGGWGHGETV